MKIISTLAVAGAVLLMMGKAQATDRAVLFFSMDDQIPAEVDATTAPTRSDINTATVAKLIAENTGAKLVRLETAEAYTTDPKVLMGQVQQLRKDSAVRHFKNEDLALDDYQVIYLGFPVWKHHAALEIDSLLRERLADLKDKKIYLFATSQHAKFNEMVAEMQQQFPKLELIEGYSLKLENTTGYEQAIEEFAKSTLN